MVLLIIALIAIATIALAAKVVYPEMLEQRQQNELEQRNKWEHVAKLFGLQFLPGRTSADNELSGTIEGFPVRIRSTETGTRYSVRIPDIGAPIMSIRRRGVSARAFDDPLRYLGKRHKTTVPFDQGVDITADDTDAVQRFLTPARKSALQELFATVGEALVTDRHVEAELFEFDFPRATTMIETTTALIKAATAMSPPQDRQLESPRDRELEPVAMSQSSLPTDVRSVLSELFDSARSGFEVDEQFAEHYLGRSVEWSGIVEIVRDFRHDSDFGTNGRKVIVNLGNSEGTSAVLSVSQTTEIAEGDAVRFSGSMMRFARVANQIYIRNGSLGRPN